MRRIPSAGSTLSTGLSKLHRPGDGAAFSAAVRMVAHIAGESSEIPGKLPMDTPGNWPFQAECDSLCR